MIPPEVFFLSNKLSTVLYHLPKTDGRAPKLNSEVITVFYAGIAINVDYQEVIKKINMKKNKEDFKGNYDEILFIKENIPSPTEIDTQDNFDI